TRTSPASSTAAAMAPTASSSPKAASPLTPLGSLPGPIAAFCAPIVPLAVGNLRGTPGVERLLVCSAYWHSLSTQPVAEWGPIAGPRVNRLADLGFSERPGTCQ